MDGGKALARLDLNLLVVFRVVAELKHVTRAAQYLGLSQPALSHALARLREALGDPLFVKSSRGMVLTPMAERLARPVAEALARLEREVLAPGPFAPATLKRVFNVRSTDLVESLVAAPLAARLQSSAPDVQISFTSTSFGLPREALETGAADLAVAGFFGDLPDGFYQQRLFTDGFLCAVRQDHPRLAKKAKLTLDAYAGERHVLISPGGELSGTVDKALKAQKKGRVVVLGTSGFTVAGFVAAGSDLVLTAPARLVSQLAAHLPLKIFAPPLALPDIKIVQVWHERNHKDEGHKWFREQLQVVCDLH